MAVFTFSGSLYETTEYEFVHEIIADSLEEAKDKFEEIIASGGHVLDLEQVGKPYGIRGNYNVFDKPESEIDDPFDFEDAILEGETFEGP